MSEISSNNSLSDEISNIYEVDISKLKVKSNDQLNKIKLSLKYRQSIIRSNLSKLRIKIKQRRIYNIRSMLLRLIDIVFLLIIIYFICLNLIENMYKQDKKCLINSLFKSIILEY